MSIKYIDDLIIDIYLKKYIVEKIDFNDISMLESYLKNLFKTLKNKYNIEIEGFYEITIYVDKFYGVIFHLEKEEFDYYDHYKNQVDMRISVLNTNFLYLVDYVPKSIIDKIEIKVKNDNIYIEIKEELTQLEMMNLLENSKVVYELN